MSPDVFSFSLCVYLLTSHSATQHILEIHRSCLEFTALKISHEFALQLIGKKIHYLFTRLGFLLHCLSSHGNIVPNLPVASCTQPSFFPFKCFHPNFRDKGLQFPASHVVNLPKLTSVLHRTFPCLYIFSCFLPRG